MNECCLTPTQQLFSISWREAYFQGDDDGVRFVLDQHAELGLHTASSFKNILKIPKGQSEYIYRRKTESTMAKRKSTKGQTAIYKTYI